MAPREPENILKDSVDAVKREPPVKSSLGLKYLKNRDHFLHSGFQWLEDKRAEDGAEGLWRIHDDLYDLRDFTKNHPGGEFWIERTKGTDITEAFEVHHIKNTARLLLPKYFIRKARTKRSSPFTFNNDGFYKVLQRRVAEVLPEVPESAATKSKLMTDLLFLGFLLAALAASYFRSYILGAASGIVLGCTAIAAHNFFHQKDNFRTYYFDFILMSSSEWKISHVLSHHIYTNTINDLEISGVEPFFQYLPVEKSFILKYMSWVYSPVIYAMLTFGHFLRTNLQSILLNKCMDWTTALPFSLLILMIMVSDDVVASILMFAWVEMVASVHFSIIGVNAAHHHPDIFHDGDAPGSDLDWGLFQLDAVMDRKDITGSHFLVLTNFGDHALHHLFPAIDHGKLEHLYPIFKKTCEEFGAEWRMSSQLELTKGQYLQLARTEPRKEPPTWTNVKIRTGKSISWRDL